MHTDTSEVLVNEGLNARVWLHMLREGGRWSAAELSRACGYADVQGVLSSMKKRGFAVSYEKSEAERRTTWGINASCKVPRGVTVQDIIDAIPKGIM